MQRSRPKLEAAVSAVPVAFWAKLPDATAALVPARMNTPYSPMLLRSFGSEGMFRANTLFEELIGCTSAELLQRPLLDWIHPEDRAAFEVAARSCQGAECTKLHAARHNTKAGEWVQMQWRFRDHNGQVFATGQPAADATALAKPSGQPDDATSLAETLDAMARIVETSNPGMLCSILLIDDRGERIVGGAGPSLPAAYNKAVEGLLIGPAVGSCGTASFWNMPVIVEDIENDPLWQDLLDAARIAGVKACWSYPVVGSNGSVLGAMALYDTKPSKPQRHQMDGLGIAAKMVGLAVERERLEQQLRATEKMEALGLLAGGVAHDFNNLLAVIVGNSELALKMLPSGGELAAMAKDVQAAGASAAELCQQILAYAGRGHASRELIQCNGLINEVCSLARVAKGANTRMLLELGPVEFGVVGDAAQIQSLILNLITNACEAIGDKEGEVAITTRVRDYTKRELQHLGVSPVPDAGEYVEIEIVDTGIGIDRTTLGRIFDPFFSTKSAKRGLGLSAVHGIVASHRGAMTVSSEVGVGTTFVVLLPHVTIPRAAGVATAGPAQVPPGVRVLVADDEPIVRDTVARMLRSVGIEVVTAVDGAQAVDVFAKNRGNIHCVLLDYRMPKMSGGEALREIRKLEPDCPVLLTSGFAERGLLDKYRVDGVTTVLQKPVPQGVLVNAIVTALPAKSSGKSSAKTMSR